ncbi:MAG: hypothetical protein WC271_04690 [Bacteroidales bacterium]|jgi:radical SAM superfamily enzyme|nr:hypothetical protein [Bacteroidales bacterium]NCU36180.1 hypothetical protein [Candidatus Falkowbacteria bacterium]MDD2632878.1 hypothetical protein [Bacteroidales bacterium]MDD3132537.1 hypothetical protein [Bacteroidales bacterium]MDD3527285.1 hypothetical protein [Bacteroidales bacterium]
MMLEEAEILLGLPLTTLKLHQLQIVRNTRMAKEFVADPGQFTFLSLEEYIDLAIGFLEKLSPEIVIERFAGEVPPRFLSEPNWGVIRYDQVLQKIEKKLAERNSWQGKREFKNRNIFQTKL